DVGHVLVKCLAYFFPNGLLKYLLMLLCHLKKMRRRGCTINKQERQSPIMPSFKITSVKTSDQDGRPGYFVKAREDHFVRGFSQLGMEMGSAAFPSQKASRQEQTDYCPSSGDWRHLTGGLH
ncbi:hypothetical protein L3Q82_019672, partial [Scortum barcoo]